ncbi:MAG: SEC-C domain-containing protein [Lachnospiraceae bacterium]|jgi:preprotein translocase subunit SecA|nr:SEC-C domain-containing protein [Lachnospiraceae bacterium]MCH4029904.1 SEC-C domain-containing protein [Lachnospiraceae bacterium]MCI1303031.1 SEC-C domain-containing protein [Lachnospiraceae bacterium]MCI1332379.1 SEC-C domain-containing protein [Lachnospiraceae bacterium]MCI1361764.1 SEC-C domain-containing protein [Lachnospiraceae bacterium]
MTLLENWRKDAYESEDQEANKKLWQAYFAQEKGIYEKVLAAKEPYKGTVKELADTFGVSLEMMTGFLDGINDSLKEKNPIETMDENTAVSLDFDAEKLFYNMVACKASWLYELPEWDALLDEKTRKTLWLKQKKSGTIVKPKKIGRNDPCPCGSGKKYKNCCGRPGLRKYDV